MAGACSGNTRGAIPEPSPKAVPANAMRELRRLADSFVRLPDGRVWVKELRETPRAEVWIPAIGLARWSGRLGGGAASQRELARAIGSLNTQSSGGAATAAIALVSLGLDPTPFRDALTSPLPSERAALLALRLDALTASAPNRPDAPECGQAARALGGSDLSFSVLTTGILAAGRGCAATRSAIVAVFCASSGDGAIADRVLDVLALLPQARNDLAVCADRMLRDVLATDAASGGRTNPSSDRQVEIQLRGPLAWLASSAAGVPRSRDPSYLSDEADRVVRDRGRTQFPPPNPSLTFEDDLMARLLVGLGVTDLNVSGAIVDTRPGAVRPDQLTVASCATTRRRRIDLLPAMAASPPSESLAEILSMLQPCEVPDVGLPDDQLAARFVQFSARLAGCVRAGRAGSVTPAPARGSLGNNPFEGDRLFRFLEAIVQVPDRQLCSSLGRVPPGQRSAPPPPKQPGQGQR